MTGMSGTLDEIRIRYAVHSIAIQTAHFENAYDFYVNILGLRVVRSPFRFGSRTLTWLDGGGILIELFSGKSGEQTDAYNHKAAGVNHIAFVVDDLEAVICAMNANGIRITKGPVTPLSGDPKQPRILFVEGPDGTAIQFREPDRKELYPCCRWISPG